MLIKDSHRTVIPSSILRKGSGRVTPMRLPTAEMPLRTAVSMLFITLLEASGTAGTLPAKSLHHARISSFLKKEKRFEHPRDQKISRSPSRVNLMQTPGSAICLLASSVLQVWWLLMQHEERDTI